MGNLSGESQISFESQIEGGEKLSQILSGLVLVQGSKFKIDEAYWCSS